MAVAPEGAGSTPAGVSPLRWLWWLLVSLVVLLIIPGMRSVDFMPKTFWAALILGMAFAFLRANGAPRIGLTPLGAIWLAINLWTLLSLCWGLQWRVGIERWISAMALPTLAYVIARRSRFWESHGFWRAYSVLFIVISLIGCLQFLLPVGWLKPLFPKQDFLDWIPTTGAPSGTFGNRNYAGLYLSVSFPFIAWFYFKTEKKWLPLSLAAFALGVAFIMFTRTRAAWLALGLGFCFLLAAGLVGKLRAGRSSCAAGPPTAGPPAARQRLAILGCLIAVALAGGILLHPSRHAMEVGSGKLPPFKASFLRSVASIIEGLREDKRPAIWRSVLRVPVNPLAGCGYGSYPIAATPHQEDGKVVALNWEAHNDYLQAYVDTGAIGVILMLAFLGWLLLLAWRGRKSGLCAAAGAAVVTFALAQVFTFVSQTVATQMWMAGVAALLNSHGERRPFGEWTVPAGALPAGALPAGALPAGALPAGSLRILNWLGAAGLLAFALLAGCSIWADHRFYAAFTGAAGDDRPPDWSQTAREVLPKFQFNAHSLHLYAREAAQEALNAGDDKAAAVFARKAAWLHPNDWAMYLVLAEVAAKNQQWGEAAANQEHFLRIYALHATAQDRQALAYYEEKAGFPQKAAEARKTDAR